MLNRLLNKILILSSAFAFVVCTVLFAPTPINAEADGIAEIAVELNCGTVFTEKNADRKLPMASTTKIMTALIIAEECDLSEVITVPDEAVGIEGSSIYLKHGEQISIKDLLYGLMLRSGNDAACALAIHHSGSVEKFVKVMNAKATALDCVNTHFANPNGLPDSNHYTTARDLCNIACYAMKNPIFSEVASTKTYCGYFRNFSNKNKLLYKLEGANGVKTGYTEKAGRCLVSSAKRGEMDVVCVVLNCYDMFERSAKIINGCFENYSLETLSCNTVFNFEGIACSTDKDYHFVVPKNSEPDYRVSVAENGTADNAVAKLEIFCENSLIFSHNLYKIN